MGPPEGARLAESWFAFGASVAEVEARGGPPAGSREGTALAAALLQAAARYPGRDLWVMTDGRPTDGDGLAAARAVVAGGGRVHVSAPQRPAADVALLEARARRTDAGRAEVVAVVAASTDGEVVLTLARDGKSVARESAIVASATLQTVRLVDPGAPNVGAAYELTLQPGPGTPNDDRGNDALALGLRGDRRTVLAWTDRPVAAWTIQEAPFHLRHMAAWDAGAVETADLVVLGSLPYRRIGDARVRVLARFVAGGGRLLILGGPSSWGGGGWAGTVLERDLAPLRSPRPAGPGLALLVALDHSGSTAEGALDHLRDAVRRVALELGPGERLAVLPFTDRVAGGGLLEPGWLEADDPPVRREAFERALAELTAGGGTDLPQAITSGARILGAASARTRRVLLVSDGDPDHEPSVAALEAARGELRARTIGFGALLSGMPQAAELVARHVAERPGDVVLIEDSVAIPARLLHEVARLRQQEERLDAPAEVRPIAGEGDHGLARVRPTWIQSLELTPEGRLLAEAVWPTDPPGTHPFAAERTVGAGRVVALAWGPGCERAPLEAGLVLVPLATDLAMGADHGLVGAREGRGVVVRIPEAKGAGAVDLVWHQGTSRLLEVRPALFEGPGPDELDANLSVRFPTAQGTRQRPLDLPAEPPPEHRGAGVDEAALRALARAGQGQRLVAGQSPPPRARRRGPSLTPFFLILAAILLVLDRVWAAGRPSPARSPETGGHAG